MISAITILIGGALGGLLNRLRGMESYYVWIGAIVLATTVYYFSRSIVGSLAVAGGYVLGESFGWTRWIWGAQGKYDYGLDTGTRDGTLWVTKLIADEKDKKWFHQVGMSVRALWWWLPVFLPMWWFGITPVWMAVVSTLALSLLFFPVYSWANTLSLGDWKYLQKAEVMYGIVYGVVIVAALLLG